MNVNLISNEHFSSRLIEKKSDDIYKARENHKLVLRKKKLHETLIQLKLFKSKTPNTLYTANEIVDNLINLNTVFKDKCENQSEMKIKDCDILELLKDNSNVR
jgi:hypothetical protein